MALIAPMIIADHSLRDVPVHEPVDVEPLFREPEDDLRDFAEVTFRHTTQHWDLFVDEVVPGARLANMEAIGRISAAYEFSIRPESRFTT